MDFAILSVMDKIRPIWYGVADYALIRQKVDWFAKIRNLEATRCAVFLLPRRLREEV